MHLFYTPDIEGDIYTLNADESRHCVRVLRLGAGEAVSLVDGKGTWYEGVIERAEVRGCEIRITDRRELYGRRNFHLHLAVAPTKNIDRIEWMLEKCTEMGIDYLIACSSFRTEGCERRTAGKSDCGGDETVFESLFAPAESDDRFPAVGYFLPGAP